MVYTGTMIEELMEAVQREERRLAAREQDCELGEVLAADILYPGEEQLRVGAEMQFAQTA
ncbi:MAG TPA: hypothetical protein VKB56_10585 [Terriglobales bacterium]|jgi:hypothetical protein|nr:hypothetical protein [Terriglobales bacterium]